MANLPLTGNTISSSYQGLLKSGDNGALTATEKPITDGLANASTLSLGTSSASFTGTLDLSGATVTGLPAGAAGLESGSGADSMQSAASLTTVAANAAQPDSIALGDGAQTPGTLGTGGVAIGAGSCIGNYDGVALGLNAKAGTNGTVIGAGACSIGNQSISVGISACSTSAAVAIGRLSHALATDSVAIANGSCVLGGCGIAIGKQACVPTGAIDSVSVGTASCAGGTCNIAIGSAASTRGVGAATAIGFNACAYNACDISIGTNSDACGGSGIAIGNGAQVALDKYHSIAIGCGTSVTGEFAGAIGSTSSATANGAYAIGQAVTAATADTVSVKALETQTASTPTAGGIIMNDAGSTARRLNIDASGNLQIDSTPVGGGGGAAGLVSGTGTDSMQSAASLTTVAASAGFSNDIVLGNGANTTNPSGATDFSCNIVIGYNACAVGDNAIGAQHSGNIAIGETAVACSNYDGGALAIGRNAQAKQMSAIAIGTNVNNNGNFSIAMGQGACVGGGLAVAMGRNAKTQYSAIVIGEDACSAGFHGDGQVAIGRQACSSQNRGVAIGYQAYATGVGGAIAIGTGNASTDRGIIIGSGASVTTGADTIAFGTTTSATGACSVSIGRNATSTALDSVALGANVTASRANTVAGQQFESTTVGKGIVVTSPDGLTTLGIGIDNTGAIVTYTP